jgi:glycogen(starch) synthase
MRVLFWSDVFWPAIGGTEVLSLRLIRALQERGHEFLVVSSNTGTDLPAHDEYDGLPIRRFRFWDAIATMRPEKLLEVRQAIARLRREFAPDLVHVAFIAPGVFFEMQTRAAHSSPALVTMQQPLSTFRQAGPARLLRDALHSADWIAYCSGAARQEVESMVQGVADRGSVIRNALEAPPEPPGPAPVGAPRVVCVGRLDEVKGFDLALEAFAKVAGRNASAELVMIGDGPLRETLEAQAAALGIAGRTSFRGWVTPAEVPRKSPRRPWS